MSASAAQAYRGVALRVPGEVLTPAEACRVRWIKREPDTYVWSDLDDSLGCRVVVKLYRRRGPLAYARMRLGRFRAERELLALRRLEAQGIPCSPPVAWDRGYSRDHGFHEVLVTRELEGMRNLDAFLPQQQPATASQPAPDLSPLFALVRRMHAGGCFHGVLKPSNVLVGPSDAGSLEFALIDMDMTRLFDRDLSGTWVASLDLLELSGGLWRRFGDSVLRGWLASYGLRGAELETFLGELSAYARFTRQQRRRQRRRAHLFALASRLGLARPAHP